MIDWKRIVAAAVETYAPVPDAGIAVAVIRGDDLLFEGGFGAREPRGAHRIDRHTVFAIGSLTKAFTSFVALRLAELGVVALDAPVRTYLPDFAVQDDDASANMTLTDLLSGQTGVPRHDLLWYCGPFSRSQLYYRARYLDPDATPGSGFRKRFEYNSIMYAIAGLALEAAARKPWSELVKSLIFDPLSIDATMTVADLQNAPDHAAPCALAARMAYDGVDNIAPAAAINVSIAGMTKWMRLLLDWGVAPDGRRLIERSSLELLFKQHIAAPPGGGYGLGWYIDNTAAGRLLHHPGDAQGYAAYASLMPDPGIAVVALSNQNIYLNQAISPFPVNVAAAIYRALFAEPTIASRIVEAHEQTFSHRSAGEASPDIAPAASDEPSPPDYLGLYSNAGYGDLAIAQVAGRVVVSYYGREWTLTRLSADNYALTFEAFGRVFHPPLAFQRDGAGKVVGLRVRLDASANPIAFDRR
ncbi:MAG: beta-lactamase family protein [Hyphomicrobiales bacterium]|nr:beta-lactamase family protein [Hyphomicrobiales bacterium]